jgi:hypothetical protein
VIGKGVELPVVAQLGAAGRGQRADEGAAAHARGHVAELREPPVHAGGGEVVHPHQLRELARRRQLLAGLELAGLDRGREAVHDLLGQRDGAIPLQLRQVDLV